MRVLLTTFAMQSHLNLMVPLGWAFRAAGHEVCVASQPNLARGIMDSGFSAVAVGNELDLGERFASGAVAGPTAPFDIARGPDEEVTAEYALGAFSFYSTVISDFLADDAMLRDLVDVCQSWRPDLVVWDAFTYAAPIAARACGAAHVRFLFGMDHFARMRSIYFDGLENTGGSSPSDPMRSWLTNRLGQYGLEFHEDVLYGQVTVDPIPPAVQLPHAGAVMPMRYVPFGGGVSVPRWAWEPPQRPRVCLTWGLTAQDHGLPIPGTAELLEAVAELDIEVISTLDRGKSDIAPRLPDNVRIVDFLPLADVLPTCSAVVHHFGIGTCSTAMVSGVPQLHVGDGLDLWGESVVAQRLVREGCALSIAAHDVTAGTVRTSLERLVHEPAFASHAARIQHQTLAVPTPHDVASDLVEFVRGNTSSG